MLEIIQQYTVSWVVNAKENGQPVALKVNREDLTAVLGTLVQSGITWFEVERIDR